MIIAVHLHLCYVLFESYSKFYLKTDYTQMNENIFILYIPNSPSNTCKLLKPDSIALIIHLFVLTNALCSCQLTSYLVIMVAVHVQIFA